MASYYHKSRHGDVAWFAVIAIIGIIFLAAPLLNERLDSYEIQEITKVENVSGDQDGFRTDVYHLVYTDKGMFSIKMSGLNSHPECVGKLASRQTDRVMLRTRGLRIQIFGMYPNIIEVKN